MIQQTSPGTCSLCKAAFDKGAMAKHLADCERRDAPPKGKASVQRLFHLLIEGAGLPEYWLHVEVPAAATLGDLDAFLRRTWLECCGHLSMFVIGKRRFQPSDPYDSAGNMEVGLGEVLRPRMKFHHEYDFGTTTELVLRVLGKREGPFEGKVPHILARNDPPQFTCTSCGKPATEMCTQCIYDDAGWLCKACGKKHECGEEMLLPAVNSPRVGMCGYTG